GDTYVLGRTDAETKRLILQDQIYGPITRGFFQAAGIGMGMKVLDVGSGAGDVALLLADLVGPRGPTRTTSHIPRAPFPPPNCRSSSSGGPSPRRAVRARKRAWVRSSSRHTSTLGCRPPS